MVSRGLSLFLPVACGAVPRKRREAFVATAVRRASPFSDPAWHVAWSGDLAMVWVWPREELSAAPDAATDDAAPLAAGTRPTSVIHRFIPESLLHGEPRESGVELLACSDGVEARAWRQGALYASSWWPQVPDAGDWMAFCRGAGVPPQALPEVQPLAWRTHPWTVVRSTSLRDTLARYQQQAIPATAALLLLVAAWQAGGLLRVQLGRMQLQSRIEASSQTVSGILDARNRAEDDLAATRQLLALRPPSSQIRLMAIVARLLDPMHATVVQWTMVNPSSLEVVIAMDSPDPRALVLAFQRSGAFDEVGADVGTGGRNQIVMRARVRPVAAAATTQDAAGAS